MTRKFPDNFVFGAATAAFQAEGALTEDGRGPCYWDAYLKDKFDPSTASDFYHRYPADLAACRKYGINGIRISIAWSRVIPDGSGEVNAAGLAYYDRLIDECLKNGVEPFVTLHHFDTPEPLYAAGDWLNRDNIDHFIRFARVCFEHFGDRVKKWITINEIYSVVAGQYVIGHFPPNIKYDIPKELQAMHNMMVAHSRVVNLYKEMGLPGEIGIVHILEGKYPFTREPADVRAAEMDDTVANRFLLDATFRGDYSDGVRKNVAELLDIYGGILDIRPGDLAVMAEASRQLDFLGLNYYASHFVMHHDGESGIFHNGTGEKGTSLFCLKGIGKRVKNPEVPTTDWDWAIYPEGLYDMLRRIQREYPACRKIYITENGMGAKDVLADGQVIDDGRIDYIAKHLDAVLRAVEEGVNVQGYFLWSLMDVLSWTNGYKKRYGFFYVDFATQRRYAKKSASWFMQVARQKELVDPASIAYEPYSYE